LLLQKHRSRYSELFDLEHHWRNTRGFWPSFLRGADKYGVAIPSEMLERVP
jgi:hypothetical protein